MIQYERRGICYIVVNKLLLSKLLEIITFHSNKWFLSKWKRENGIFRYSKYLPDPFLMDGP